MKIFHHPIRIQLQELFLIIGFLWHLVWRSAFIYTWDTVVALFTSIGLYGAVSRLFKGWLYDYEKWASDSFPDQTDESDYGADWANYALSYQQIYDPAYVAKRFDEYWVAGIGSKNIMFVFLIQEDKRIIILIRIERWVIFNGISTQALQIVKYTSTRLQINILM